MLTDVKDAVRKMRDAVSLGQGDVVTAANRLIESVNELLAAHSAGAQEPVAYTHPDRLALLASGKLQVETMWSKSLVDPGDVPLYTQPQPMTDAARDVLAEIITARKAMLKRIDDVHAADRQTGCNTFYDNELERHTALLFRAIDAEIERIEREGEA